MCIIFVDYSSLHNTFQFVVLIRFNWNFGGNQITDIFLSMLFIYIKICYIQKLVVMPSVQFSSVTQSCLTLCDPMNRSTPGLPVHH